MVKELLSDEERLWKIAFSGYEKARQNHQWKNRAEIFLQILEEYQDVKDGIRGNVVGMDLELQLPEKPDIRLVNDGKKTPEEICRILLEELGDAIS